MTYANTFIVDGADVWEEAVAGDHLVKDRRGEDFLFLAPTLEESGLAELFRPETRAFVQRELEETIALGSDGWMADFAEWYPADPRDVRPADGSDPQAAHHRYPLEWARVNRDAVTASGRDDVVVFLRSGYTGSQGAASVIWAGDQRTTFDEDDGLPTIIPIMIGLGASGFPIVTHDIAGYVSATNPPASKELFLRWTALGALNPIMRTHHGRSAFANWRWSSDQETIAVFKRWADLHTRLFPLWYGLAFTASAFGHPIVRSPALHYPGDVRLHAVDDAYLIGDALYVAPVVTASTAARVVLLPEGGWYNFFGPDDLIAGGGSVEVEVPLGEAAIFARAGAIVPMLPEGVESLRELSGSARNERVVIVWLGAKGSFVEAEGGIYVLNSAARPAGSGRKMMTATGNAITCPFEQQCLETISFDPGRSFTFDFRW
jgi:sulfoquinovosidase